jgi:hypothetical protein
MAQDLINPALEVVLTDETTGYKCNPDVNGNLPVLAGQTGAWYVGGEQTLFPSETYNTTNTDAQARPVNGNLDVQHKAAKTIVIINTGAQSARINVKASVDGVNFDIFLSTNTLLAAGNTLVVNDANAHTHVQILARSNTAGNATAVVTRAYARGI